MRDIASSVPAAAEPLVEERRVVAVIGIDRYRGWPMLSNAVHDARGALTLFERCGFAPITPPLIDDAATGDAIRRLVTDDLAALRNTDSLMVFFAGHGHTQTRTLLSGPVKTGYLIPVDGDQPGGRTASWLRLDSWLSDIARLPARHILVVLDACHSGIALGSLIKWRGSGKVREDALDALRRRQSRRVITSALGDQRAMDNGPLQGHSLFTGCLIEGLTGGLARDGRREVTASEIGLYVQRRVADYTESRQTPDFGALELDQRGELVVPLASVAPVDAPVAGLAPPQAPAAHTIAASPTGAAAHAAKRAPDAFAPERLQLVGAPSHASPGVPTGPTSAIPQADSRSALATPGRSRLSKLSELWTDLPAWVRKLIVVSMLIGFVLVMLQFGRNSAENRFASGAGAPPSAASAAKLTHSLATSNLESGRLWLLDGHPMQALPYLAAARVEGIDGSAIRLLFGQAMGSVPSVTLAGHDAAVRSVAFNPEGTQLVTTSDDGNAQIWPTPWGNPARQTLSHRGPITSARFSSDGVWVVTVSQDRTARVWHATTGNIISAPFEHDGAVRAAAFSPDGRYVATASQNAAQVWNVLTGSKLGKLFEHQGAIASVVFNENGKRLLTASTDHTARIWDMTTTSQLLTFKHDGAVTVAAYSSDGAQVVTASEDGTARIWDGATGKPITPPLQHQESVRAAVFSGDGKRVITASDDRTAKVWDAAAGTLATTLEHQDAVIAAAFSPDGARVATASRDHTARVWEVASGAPITVPLLHQGAITSLAFSPDGKQVVTASEDRAVRLWDATMKTRVTVTLHHHSPIHSARFNTDGTRVVTAGDDHMLRAWDPGTGVSLTPPFGDRGPLTVAFSEDGRWVATARKKPPVEDSGPNEVTVWDPTVWDVMTGRPAAAPLHHQYEVTAMALSRDGARIATASSDLTARAWNVMDGSPLTASLETQGRVVAMAFSPDGTRLATASKDNNTQLWDVKSGKLTAALEHGRGVTAVAFSPDGTLLITASENHTASVWNVATGGRITPPLQHHGIIRVAVFSPDSRRALTASDDGTARVWDAASGMPVTPPLEHHQGVTAAAFNFDGTLVATASKDSTARIWDAATGHPLMAALEHQKAVTVAQFSPDGSHVLTASSDGTARVQLLPIATGSAAGWQGFARCSSFTLINNTLALNSEPKAVCP